MRACDTSSVSAYILVQLCLTPGAVGLVDASLIQADANKQRSIAGQDWRRDHDPVRSSRAVKECLATLDDTAWGAAGDVVPKFISPSDPAAQWTGAHKRPAFFAYSDHYLIDVKFGVIVDVEASRSIRHAEGGAAKTIIERPRSAWSQAGAACRRYRLRGGSDAELAGRGEGHRLSLIHI